MAYGLLLASLIACHVTEQQHRQPSVVRLLLDNPLAMQQRCEGRYYQRGFGPRSVVASTTTLPNLPRREDAYVTNSFEYLAVSNFF